MNLTDAQVTLTYHLRGAQLLPGVYSFREKVLGKILPKNVQCRTVRFPKYAECIQTILLPESFVNHAISVKGRPNRNKHSGTYTFWQRMSPKERLGFHIKTYVSDLGGGDYFYDILI